MDLWYRSDVTHACMEGLIKHGLLRGRTNAIEWLVLGREDAPALPNGYVISFTLFHERGLTIPGLLHHYQIKLQHLNPNKI